jgi:hypothetical protein
MEIQSSPVRSTMSELNGGEGGGPAARGAALSSGEAPGPMYEDGKWVRQLGIDDMAETKVRNGGGGLPRRARGAGMDEMQRVGHLLYVHPWRERVTGWLGCDVQRMAALG